MNGLMLLAWIVGLGFLGACYLVAVGTDDAGHGPEDDLPAPEYVDRIAQHEQWRLDRAARLGIEQEYLP